MNTACMDWPSATTPDTTWEADTLHSDTTSYFSADRHYARTLPQHLPSPTQHRALQHTSIPPHTSTRYGNRHGLVCAPAIYDETCDQVQPSCHLSPSLSRVEMLLTQAALLTDMGTDPLTQAQSLLNEWADNTYSNVLTHTMDDDDDTMMDSFPDCHGAGSAADDVSRMVLRRVYQTTRSTDTARASPAWGIAVDDRDSNILDSSHMRSDSDRNDFSELARSLVDTVTTTPTSKEKKLVRNTGCVAPSDLRLGIAARQQAVQERKQALALQRNKEIQARIYQKEVQQTRRQQQLHEQQQAMRALQLEREITAKMMKDQETERQLDAAIQAIDTQNARKVAIQEEAIERESEASINGARKQILKNQTHHLEIITRRIESITTLRNLKLLKGVFSEWRRVCLQGCHLLLQHQTVWSWRIRNRYWIRWMDSYRSSCHARKKIVLQDMLIHQQSQIIKAARFHRSRVLSRAFLSLKMEVQTQKNDRYMKKIHAQRAVQMQHFINRLESKHSQNSTHTESTSLFNINGQPTKPDIVDIPQALPAILPTSADDSLVTSSGVHAITSVKLIPDDTPSKLTDIEHVHIHTVKTSHKPSSRSTKKLQMDTRFIREMEKRQLERDNRRKEIADQLEKRHQAAELVKAKMEHEAIEEKERQRQEIIKLRKKAEEEAHMKLVLIEQRRHQFEQRLVQVNTHYQLSIQKYYGIRPWIAYINQIKACESRAIAYDATHKQHTYLIYWRSRLQSLRDARLAIAVQTHAKRRLYQSISTWKSRLDTYRGLFTRASQSLTQRVMLGHFLRWMGSYHVKAAKRRAEEDQKCRLADVLASRIVSRRYIQRWKQFVDIQKDNRWREFQRLQLQAKVKSILDESGSLERVLESTTMDLGWSYT
ncbi:hypothetical protein BASA50_005448 [Batrachochytrium salamandrivorans]|uniref:Sfi1 spindle body domain-containing protein n=1 Tax=Batrachochytrium salamandrivorans TaxID=1357716 RepID=A0ABQ8FCM8_9FUNG|nr:hypothetical protein BASA50_005448 [Batrachochytrium salamandrivorans]KAH9269252.1 hypothetical protein BASA83_008744 [Batrachochytrium salamandrivorans]